MKQKKSVSGFSLWEVLISLLILSCLLGLGLPSLHKLHLEYQSKRVVHALAMALNRARREALTLHTSIRVVPQVTWEQGIQILQGTRVIQGIRWASAGDSVQIHWIGFGPHALVQFDAQGQAYGNNGHFEICVQEKCWKIVINPTGRIRVVPPESFL